MHTCYSNGLTLATSVKVRGFLARIVLELQCDADLVRTAAVQLGSRHRLYFDEGFHQSYWDSFCRSIHDSITELVTTYAEGVRR